MNEIQEAVTSALAQVIGLVIAAAAAVVVAWLRERALQIAARSAAIQVELEAQVDPTLKGDAKLLRARELLAASAGQLAPLNPRKLIEAQIPAARVATASAASSRNGETQEQGSSERSNDDSGSADPNG